MDLLAFYGNTDFPNGMGSAKIHDLNSLAIALTEEYNRPCRPGLLELELAKSPLPKWIEWLRVDDEKEDIADMPMQWKANVFGLTRLLLHHLGVDITPEQDTKIVQDESSEGILLCPRMLVPKTENLVRLSAWKLASYLVSNLFALGQYQLAVSVANKLLMLTYNLIEILPMPEATHSIVMLFNTCAKLVVKWWKPDKQSYRPDQRLNTPKPPTPDVWTSKKTNKSVGVCAHKLLRARSNGKCFLSQVRETEAHSCD
jgi:hypothetical protein